MAFTPGNTNVKKNNYNVFLTCATASPAITNQLIGACLAEPSIMEEKGDDVKINDGTSPVVSKNCSVAFTVVNVNKDNYDALRSIVNKPCSVVLSTASSHNGTLATGEWKISNVLIFPALTAKGNAINQIECTGTKEVGADDTTTVATA